MNIHSTATNKENECKPEVILLHDILTNYDGGECFILKEEYGSNRDISKSDVYTLFGGALGSPRVLVVMADPDTIYTKCDLDHSRDLEFLRIDGACEIKFSNLALSLDYKI